MYIGNLNEVIKLKSQFDDLNQHHSTLDLGAAGTENCAFVYGSLNAKALGECGWIPLNRGEVRELVMGYIEKRIKEIRARLVQLGVTLDGEVEDE